MQEADLVCEVCGAHGGYETAEVRDVRRNGEGRGLCGGPGKRVDGVFQRLGAGIRRFHPRGGHENYPFRGQDNMIPYMVGKLAPNSTIFTRGLVKQVPGRGYFRAVPSSNGDKCVTSPPHPPTVERLDGVFPEQPQSFRH